MYDILVNKNSGTGKGARTLKKVEKILRANNIEYTVHPTEYKGHATAIVSELNARENTNLIVMGGDGSFNEAINGIINFDTITLGFVPCGTGNDYVKTAGISMNIAKSIGVIINGKVGYTDFIQVGDKRAINCVGSGMDVDILVKYATMKKFGGKIKYYLSLLYTVTHLRFHKLKITFDGKEVIDDTFLTAVANGKFIGGGMPVSPHSDVNDGKLNLMIAHKIKMSRVFWAMMLFLQGKHINADFVEYYPVDKVRIEVLDDSMVQLDGEVYDQKEMDCSVVSNTLKVFKN